MNTLPRIARFSYPWTSLTRSYRCGRVRITGAMATDSMFSHNNAPLQDCESILADVRKNLLSILTAAIVSAAMAVVGCGFGCLVQDVVCFKRDKKYRLQLRAAGKPTSILYKETLKRHWHAGCLKM
ncbi:hypothetical protein GGD66_002311 [Bradyrhizobium sp. CIR48]|uniref:hypothetical protein n=1 Tax=Bradyrhizobium sp. CIR48 TaxID=2663840 RepID=UPI001606949E|nr:hypothetical protein [Bradyrhizobium sp. CIR48]MBB4423767.1 hypothetical protein [Bradyrhizobium sp. CIR48]